MEANSHCPDYYLSQEEGFAPLHHAASIGSEGLTAWLLEVGADIEAESSFGITPAMSAVYAKQSRTLDYLLKKGASMSKGTIYGDFPFKNSSMSSSAVRDVISLYAKYGTGPILSLDGTSFRKSGRIHRTICGELVRSKSEVVICNALHYAHLEYSYEKPLWIASAGKEVLPDFTVLVNGTEIIWEHFGMLDDIEYRNAWERKMEIYEAAGFVRGKNFFVTLENRRSGLDSYEIQAIADHIASS